MKKPSEAAEKELISIKNHHKTVVNIPGTNTSVKIGWLKKGAMVKFTELILFSKASDDMEDVKDVLKSVHSQSSLLYQACAAIILNNFWKIKLFYWIYWRYLCYWKEYSYEQLEPIIEEGKKKVPVESYYKSMVSLIQMKTTIVTMTKKEAEQFLQDALLEQKRRLEKSTDTPISL